MPKDSIGIGRKIVLGDGTDTYQAIIDVDNGTGANIPKIYYNNNFIGSGIAGWQWSKLTGKTALVAHSGDEDVGLAAWSTALNKESQLVLINTTDMSDGSIWLMTKMPTTADQLSFEHYNLATTTTTETFQLKVDGTANILTGFSVGGTAAVADGTYTMGTGSTNGTITTKGGIITAVQEVIP